MASEYLFDSAKVPVRISMKFRFRPEADIAESVRLGQPRPHTCTVEYNDAVQSASP